MKKRTLIIGILFLFANPLFAEAAELKNMMPNSWQKLTRLSAEAEQIFISDAVVQEAILKLRKEFYWNFKESQEDIRVYQETVNGITFYRLLYCNIDFNNFLLLDCTDAIINTEEYDYYFSPSVIQFLFINNGKKMVCLFDDVYSIYRNLVAAAGNMENPGGYFFQYVDLFIKPLNKEEIGFFKTTVSTEVKIEGRADDTTKIVYPKYKGQLEAFNACIFGKLKASNKMPKLFSDGNFIRIEASHCLFEPKCPFKYSIQNAFDGNASTSYVENTEDDLMRIRISAEGVFDKIKLINGYAKNNELYYSNNRIKTVASEFDFDTGKMIEWGQKLTDKNKRFPVQDDILTNQNVHYFTNGYFFVSDIYKGKLYNDTCLAELDFCNKTGNWVFGNIYE